MLAAFEDDAKVYIVFKACMRGDLYQLLMKEPSRQLAERLVATTVRTRCWARAASPCTAHVPRCDRDACAPAALSHVRRSPCRWC